VERKGFCENHLYGTVTTHFVSSISLILTPEKKALGNFKNKNILNFRGCFIPLMNALVSAVVINNLFIQRCI